MEFIKWISVDGAELFAHTGERLYQVGIYDVVVVVVGVGVVMPMAVGSSLGGGGGSIEPWKVGAFRKGLLDRTINQLI